MASPTVDVIEALKNNTIIICGAGTSLALATGCYDWPGLANQLIDHFVAISGCSQSAATDLLGITSTEDKTQQTKKMLLDYAATHNMVEEMRYNHLIYDIFKSIKLKNDVNLESCLAEAIAALNMPIATTNYDLVLEESLQRVPVNVLRSSSQFFDINHHKQFIFHLHGTYFDERGFVLTRDEYAKQQGPFENALAKMTGSVGTGETRKNLLFIGCGEGIVDFLPFLRSYGDMHYYCLVDDNFELPGGREITDSDKDRITLLRYGSQHSELPKYVFGLAYRLGWSSTRIITVNETGTGRFQHTLKPANPVELANGGKVKVKIETLGPGEAPNVLERTDQGNTFKKCVLHENQPPWLIRTHPGEAPNVLERTDQGNTFKKYVLHENQPPWSIRTHSRFHLMGIATVALVLVAFLRK